MAAGARLPSTRGLAADLGIARNTVLQVYEQLTEEGYANLTGIVAGIAARHAHRRLLSSLEGGYNLRALAASVDRHVQALVAS